MLRQVIPFPPFWEAQFHKITSFLFSRTGNHQFLTLPLWLEESQQSVVRRLPQKSFFQLLDITYQEKRILFTFAIQTSSEENRLSTQEIIFPPVEETVYQEVLPLLTQLSRRRLKSKPCWADFKESSVAIFR